jgi:hypothetical protein
MFIIVIYLHIGISDCFYFCTLKVKKKHISYNINGNILYAHVPLAKSNVTIKVACKLIIWLVSWKWEYSYVIHNTQISDRNMVVMFIAKLLKYHLIYLCYFEILLNENLRWWVDENLTTNIRKVKRYQREVIRICILKKTENKMVKRGNVHSKIIEISFDISVLFWNIVESELFTFPEHLSSPRLSTNFIT